MSRSSIGAVGTASYGQRTMSPAHISAPHYCLAFAANIPGRRNVHWSPEASIRRSICKPSSLAGLGRWNKGCAVLSGAERNTMRRACLAIRSKAGATAAGGATYTRNTVSMPSTHASRVSGSVRSPRTTSTCRGKRAPSGCVSALGFALPEQTGERELGGRRSRCRQ